MSPTTDYDPTWTMALRELAVSEREEIIAAMTPQHFRARRRFLRQGEPEPSLYVVDKGSVRVYHTSTSGGEFTAKVTGAGGMVGMVAAISGNPSGYSVECLEPVDLRSLAAPALLGFMERIPRFAFNMSRVLARMYDAGLQRSARLIDSVEIRLIKVLCELAVREVREDGIVCGTIHGLTQEDLASMVGASRPWISLTLTALERQGMLVKKKGAIAIRDVYALARFGECVMGDGHKTR